MNLEPQGLRDVTTSLVTCLRKKKVPIKRKLKFELSNRLKEMLEHEEMPLEEMKLLKSMFRIVKDFIKTIEELQGVHLTER